MFEDFDAFAARIPLAGILGMRLLAEEPGAVRLALDPRPDMLQVQDRLHGGVIATLADTAAVWAVQRDLDRGRAMTSIEFKLNFLRPATLDGGELVAAAGVVRCGRRVALVDTDVFQGGERVAKGLFTYMLLDRDD